jgi:hypothetical protein
VKETPFIAHRSSCEHCKTAHLPCEVGAQIIRRTMAQILSGTKKETHAQTE